MNSSSCLFYKGADKMILMPMQTAIEIYVTLFSAGIILSVYFYFVYPEFKKTNNVFILLYILQLIGGILIYFRGEINIFTSVVVANFLILLGILMVYHVVINFTKAKMSTYFVLGLLGFYLLYANIFTFIWDNTDVRIVLHNASHIAVLIYSLVLLRRWNKANPNYHELFSPIIVFAIIVLLYRLVNNFFAKEYGNDILNYDQGAFGVVLSGVANLLMLIGFLSFINTIRSQELAESERSKTSLLSNIPGFAYRCMNDPFWTMKFISDGLTDMTGYNKEEIINNEVISFEDIIAPKYQDEVRISWNRAINNHTKCVTEYQIVKKDGSKIWVWEQGVGIYDKHGKCTHVEGYIVDIDSRKMLEENLTYLSYKDHLTGLYNRRFIEDQLNRLDVSRNLPITVIIIDMNGLKFINDSFGHEAGDEAIIFVANTLKKSLRGYELIARLSGDEFIVVLENTDSKQADKIAERIQKNIKKYEGDFEVSIAIGHATKTNSEESLNDIRNIAEDKMYKAKMYEKPSHRRRAVDAVLQTLFEKDTNSEKHSRYVSKFSKILAEKAGLSTTEINKAETAGLLHDVGKIVVDVKVLKSVKELTEEEYTLIKSHSEIGYRILNSVPELADIADIILSHHEKLDGSGYPNGLTSEEIPYISKIISVCDAYDAMVNKRYYRIPLTKEQAITELRLHAGTQFDPHLVELFVETIDNE